MLSLVEILDIKYLNNIVEQNHRWVKQKTRQALDWKSKEGALASLHGREVWTMLKQDQIDIVGQRAFERFYALAV
ncbi:transposase [Vibrio crassostreae]|nr:transposase [Vibrio crassostreae]CAK3589115.1 transposase [Vibrio crassostreae]CAK4028310.1 transposase [Vibrio crassostreae]